MIRQYIYLYTATYKTPDGDTCRSSGKIRASDKIRATAAVVTHIKKKAKQVDDVSLDDSDIVVVIKL